MRTPLLRVSSVSKRFGEVTALADVSLDIKAGEIHAQKSYLEAFFALHMLHWLNTNTMKVVPDVKAAGINPLPENVMTGVMKITKENVAQFKHV